jgi:signal transduction histidine kinase
MKKNDPNERILIMAPLGRDALAMADVLTDYGFGAHVCSSPAECCAQISHGVGALLITDEVLELEGALDLLNALKAQPPWSELPLIILTTNSELRLARLLELAADAAGSLTLLERPIGTTTLLRSVEVALSSRRRQYENRNLVVKLANSGKALEYRVRNRTRELRVINAKLKGEIKRRKGLEGEILAISDREQQRLGQELHDGLCQHLTAVAFMARSVALRLKNHRVVDAGDIEKIAQLVNDAATNTRDLSRALHRLDVDSAGFIPALQDLVDREIWRTPCRLQVNPLFQMKDDTAATHLYRIAREAVINANKHAQAREIVIKLASSRRELVLRVIDDGVGVSEESLTKRGLGFHIMNYRAQLIGGRLEIDSPQTGGTHVSCYLPIHAPRQRKAANGEKLAGSMQNYSNPQIEAGLTLRHLAQQGAANGKKRGRDS